MAEPIFIDNNPAQILADIISDYEARSGQTLQPASVERIIIDIMAYREGLLRQGVQDTALNNLVEFSIAPYIDYLGALVGVTRQPAQGARALFTANLVTGHSGVTIPAGTRFQSVDGMAIFQTQIDYSAPVGVFVINNIEGVCQALDTSGNGYGVGTITNILDPLPFLTSVSNTTVSGGGSGIESDNQLRERIRLAPNQYSTAGSKDSYKFHALSASPVIIDVAVVGPPQVNPGEVHLFPLMDGGVVTPAPILNLVYNAVNSDKVRPLTDTVVVTSPQPKPYNLTVNVILYDTADVNSTMSEITNRANDFVAGLEKRLGRDVTDSQIMAALSMPEVYDIDLAGFSNVIVSPTEFAKIGTLTVNYMGSMA